MFECCGCQEVTVRQRIDFSEAEPGNFVIHFYPTRIARHLPQWKSKLSKDMVSLLEEVYSALHADSRRLAMMGARALIDMVMIDKVGDKRTFADKLNALHNNGLVSSKHRQVLKAAFDVGSAAIHRGHRSDSKQVQLVMDIVENLLQTTILQSVDQELQNATPKRKRITKSPPKNSKGKND